jgi:dihydrofolate reductase
MIIRLILLQSIDGFIARDNLDDLSWGSKEDKALFSELIREVEYKVMGSTTFESMRNFPALLGKHSKTLVLTGNPGKYNEYSNPYSQVLFKKMSAIEVVDLLDQQGVKSIAIVGGSSVYSQFLEANLVDEIYVTIAPKIFGSGIKFSSTAYTRELQLMDMRKIGQDDVLLKYNVISN